MFPRSPRRRARAGLALLALATTGCLGPRGTQVVTYYRIDPLPPAPAAPEAAAPALALRVRRVTAAGHLRERLAVRTSRYSLQLEEFERWSEPPLDTVVRALTRALFEAGDVQRGEGTDSVALDLELAAFEELRAAGERRAEIAFSIRLTGADGMSLLDRTFARAEPLEGEGETALAEALSRALAATVDEARDAVRLALVPLAPQ